MQVSFDNVEEDAKNLVTCFMEIGLDEEINFDGDKPDMDRACRKFKTALSNRNVLGSVFADYYPQPEDFLDREYYDEAFDNFEDSKEGKYLKAVIKKAEAIMVVKAKATD